jgi:hypothetical protein
MTADQLKAKLVAGKWSTLEVVSHLTDFALIDADRDEASRGRGSSSDLGCRSGALSG